jgi:transposase-like protein
MFNSHDECLTYLEKMRWGEKPICPYCNSANATAYKEERRYHCNNCFTSYSVTVGTIFHKTHVNLQKWLFAIQLVSDSSGSISVRDLAKKVGVSKNTAHRMSKQIKLELTKPSETLTKYLNVSDVA